MLPFQKTMRYPGGRDSAFWIGLARSLARSLAHRDRPRWRWDSCRCCRRGRWCRSRTGWRGAGWRRTSSWASCRPSLGHFSVNLVVIARPCPFHFGCRICLQMLSCQVCLRRIQCHFSNIITTECVNSSVARFARKFLSKFPRPVGHTTAAVQPSKKKIARGTYTKTF